MDIIRNSIAAEAKKITVCITADVKADRLDISEKDDGEGMDKDMLKRVTGPFETSRKERRQDLAFRF
jgi:signal transduction histidine kinase